MDGSSLVLMIKPVTLLEHYTSDMLSLLFDMFYKIHRVHIQMI